MSKVQELENQIQELKGFLKLAQDQEAKEWEKRKKATPVIMEYSITPTGGKNTSYDKIYDDSCITYRLEGTVVNKDEATKAGHKEFHEGGMNYLFNSLSGKIVFAHGGGRIHIGRSWNKEGDEIVKETLDLIGQFLVENPKGGDITDIVRTHNER